MNKIVDLCRDCEHRKITGLGWCHDEYLDDEFCSKGYWNDGDKRKKVKHCDDFKEEVL